MQVWVQKEHRMKRVLAVICLAAVMMGIWVGARTEGPSARMRSYGAGKYKVGKNLGAGEEGEFAIMKSTDLPEYDNYEVSVSK